MHRLSYALLLVAFFLLAACTQRPATGNLDVVVAGLPAGQEPQIRITGPGNYDETIAGSQSLSDLAVGTYELAPATEEVANTSHAGVERFDADGISVDVREGETETVTVEYGYSGFSLTDEAGDALGESASQPIYDIEELASVVTEDALELTLTFSEEQTDFSDFVAIIHLDVDQDPASGEISDLGGFCTATVDLGVEYEVNVDVDLDDNSILEFESRTVVGEATVTASENVMSVSVPLAVLGGADGRADAAAVIGNNDEPTDCVPFGTADF